MKLTSPSDMAPDVSQLESALERFEMHFLDEEKGLKDYRLIILGELNRPTCNAVEKAYSSLGWIAKCRTSSENGERAGLTELHLSLK